MSTCVNYPPPYRQADQLEVARLDASKAAAERERREEVERQRIERHKQDQVRASGGGKGIGSGRERPPCGRQGQLCGLTEVSEGQ